MTELASVAISVDGKPYKLARQQDLLRLGLTARNWQVEHPAIAAQQDKRPDVIEGDVPGEKVLVINDWSKGITGDRDPIPGTYHRCSNFAPWNKGRLRKVGCQLFYSYVNDPGVSAQYFLRRYKHEMFLAAGVDLYGTDSVGLTPIQGPGGVGYTMSELITACEVFDDKLYIGQGPSTKVGVLTDLVGPVTAATQNVYAQELAVVRDKFWRSGMDATSKYKIDSCDSGTNPQLTASWGGDYRIGDSTWDINELCAYGEHIAASKGDGLYIGDTALVFPNALESMKGQADPRNGVSLISDGSALYYTHAAGLIRFSMGLGEEIGWQQVMTSAEQTEAGSNLYGYQVTALAAQGKYIWVAVSESPRPYYTPTGVLITLDNESTFNASPNGSALANCTDGSIATVLTLDNFSTAAAGDYFYVGYSEAFAGVYIQIKAPNVNTSTLTAEYWNGASWISLPTGTGLADGTTLGGATLRVSGAVRWQNGENMTAKTINSLNRFWARFSVSATLDAEVEVSEIRVIDLLSSSVAQRGATVFRLRPAQAGDARPQSYIWDEYMNIPDTTGIGALAVTRRFPYPFEHSLLMAGRDGLFVSPLTVDSTNYIFNYDGGPNSLQSTATVISPRDHCGSPNVSKQFLGMTINGRNVSSSAKVSLYYRVNDATTWTTLQANIDSLPYSEAMSGITGYRIQVKVVAETNTTNLAQEIESIEIRYRELPTTKRVYRMMLELADKQVVGKQGLPVAATQLSNLRGDQAVSAVTLLDPLRASVSVNVVSVREVEAYQDERGYPAVLCEVVACEI